MRTIEVVSAVIVGPVGIQTSTSTIRNIDMHYGLYEKSKVWYLEQKQGSDNALGLKTRSPFKIGLREQKVPCCHNIDLHQSNPLDIAMAFAWNRRKDPLFKIMAPLPADPTNKIFAIKNTGYDLQVLLQLMSRMSSPTGKIIKSSWKLPSRELDRDLENTNLAPLVLDGFVPDNFEKLERTVNKAIRSPRKILLVVDETLLPPPTKLISTTLNKYPIADLSKYPWEAMGAYILRKYMQGGLD